MKLKIYIVCKKIDPIQSNQLSGVNEIPFTKEDGSKQFYIGMASRKHKTRIKERIADIKYNKEPQRWLDYAAKNLYTSI